MNTIDEITVNDDDEDDDEKEDEIIKDIDNCMNDICLNYFTKNIESLKELPDIADNSNITYTVHQIITTMIEDCPFTAIETELVKILIANYNYNIDSKQFIGHINIAELITDLQYFADNLNNP
jgi:hypothetical protein